MYKTKITQTGRLVLIWTYIDGVCVSCRIQ